EVETLSPIRLRISGDYIDCEAQYDPQRILEAEVRTVESEVIRTTVGRVILNQALPPELPFINGLLKKRALTQLVAFCHLRYGNEVTVKMLDSLKETGFLYATLAGISIGIDDMVIPEQNGRLIDDAM